MIITDQKPGSDVGRVAHDGENCIVTYVYLSYDRRESDYLARLANELVHRGVSIQFAEGRPTAKRFDSVVRLLIDGCAAILGFRSAAESESPEVTREIEYATAIGKP